jgi:2,3-bisphosphoglycerate-independent phosphoglycerate mutase
MIKEPRMKYVIIIPDGCADEPQSELGGLTPLAAARTPAMDELASMGIVGRANHTPRHLPPGSDVANLSLLGYDPRQHFTGRAPLEAAAQKIPLKDNDWVVRCNLVTIEDQIMRDFTADHIGSDEARELLNTAQQEVAADGGIQFFAGVSYRNLVVISGDRYGELFSEDTRTTPPHDLTDHPVTDGFPRGPGSKFLCELMQRSQQWFMAHPTNVVRQSAGRLPATNVWLWGLGRRPLLTTFAERFGIRGAMITGVDLLRGLANLVGWEQISVPGATGYLDTDYRGKGIAAIEALQTHDLVCVHVEAPDEAAHQGNLQAKIDAIEAIDREIVRPILDSLKGTSGWRVLVSPDHPTLLSTKTHCHGDVPFVIAGTGIEADGTSLYNEASAATSQLEFPEGHRLLETCFLLNRVPTNV